MAVSVAAALLLGAVFAGDSVWTAVAAVLIAGIWGAPGVRRLGAVTRWRRHARRAPARDGGGAGSRSPGRSRRTSRGPSSTGRSSTPRSSPSASCSQPIGPMPRDPAAAALTRAFGAGVVWRWRERRFRRLSRRGRAARLRDPIGYWNALALAADALLVLAPRSQARHARLRCGWAVPCSPTRRSWRSCSRRLGQAPRQRHRDRALALAPSRPGRGGLLTPS